MSLKRRQSTTSFKEERKPTISVKKEESVDVGLGVPSRAKTEEDVKPKVPSFVGEEEIS